MTFLVKTYLILNPLGISFHIKASTIPILNISVFNSDFFPGLFKYFHMPNDQNHPDFSMKSHLLLFPLKSGSPPSFPNFEGELLITYALKTPFNTTPCSNKRQMHLSPSLHLSHGPHLSISATTWKG